MHRVELKALISNASSGLDSVPNAPCGVESASSHNASSSSSLVPNAPCGVESLSISSAM